MHDALLAIVNVALIILALVASLPCAYLLLLTLLSGVLRIPPRSARTQKFDVVVPAHNEAAGIARTIANLFRLDWPPDRFRVLVVADNCTDNTSDIARDCGARVLIRNDPERRGKGYALAHAFEISRTDGRADAVVVVDADSEASSNLLEAISARLERGAKAVQVHYGVLNAGDSWRTRLMAIALGSFHMLRSRARERLKVSAGIRGNGWCVTHSLLNEVPYRAFSLTEDIEFGIELGLKGHRVVYSEEARVDGEMVTTETAARSQRQRWEGGRFKLLRTGVPRLAREAVGQGGRICVDLILDLLVLPLSYVALTVIVYLIASLLAWYYASTPVFTWLALVDMTVLFLYVMRGWQLSKVGARGLLDLARAPAFIAWKVLLMLTGGKVQHWIRTEREGS